MSNLQDKLQPAVTPCTAPAHLKNLLSRSEAGGCRRKTAALHPSPSSRGACWEPGLQQDGRHILSQHRLEGPCLG